MSDDTERLMKLAQNPEQYAAFEEALRGRAREPGWLLVLLPTAAEPDAKRLAAFAEAFHIDVYTARQRLAGRAPRVILRHETRAKIDAWVDWLAKLNLQAIAVSEVELNDVSIHPQVAVWAKDGMLVFEDAAGVRVELPRKWVVAVVFGVVRERHVMRRQVVGLLGEHESAAPMTQRHEEAWIDIHGRGRAGVMRLRQDSVQYSRIFPGETGSSTVLIRRLYTMILNTVKGATVADNFQDAENVMGPSFELLSRTSFLTLHLGHPGRSVQVERLGGSTETTAPVFDLYSRLTRFIATREPAAP